MTHYFVRDDETYTDTSFNLMAGDILSISSTGALRAVTGNPLIVATHAAVENDGIVSASSEAVRLNASSLLNHGSVTGAIVGSADVESIANSGIIVGNIFLLDGKDVLDNQHGTIVGFVDPGAGDDQLVNSYGLIVGEVFMGSGADMLVNQYGRIFGDVGLGTENDSFDNRSGLVAGLISGGFGDDVIQGGDYTDVIYGDNKSGDTSGGNDTLSGGGGNDALIGGYGADVIDGGDGDDYITGNQDNDVIHGGQGRDELYGGKGDDTIDGGTGDDVLSGNLANDRFVFGAMFGHDVIADFGTIAGNNDTIQFTNQIFGSYADVQAHMVQQGTNVSIALDADDTILLLNIDMRMLTPDDFLFS